MMKTFFQSLIVLAVLTCPEVSRAQWVDSVDYVSRAKLVLPETEFDFGFVPHNGVVNHSFRLLSTGLDTLKITRVKPGCSCTSAPLEKSELAPGDSTILLVTFASGRFYNKVGKRVKIFTNEARRETAVGFSAYVFHELDSSMSITTSPSIVNFPKEGLAIGDSIVVRIENRRDTPFEFRNYGTLSKQFEAVLPKRIGAQGTAMAVFKLTSAGVEAKSFFESVTLELNDNAAARYTIPVQKLNERKITSPFKP